MSMNTNNCINRAIDIAGGLSKFAKQIGVSTSYAWQMKNGIRPVPILGCVAIERATNGQVTRKDLRPHDWQDIWPELADPPKTDTTLPTR